MENSINQIKKYLLNGQSVTVNGMPGVGISLFLKELAEKDFADFYYVDCFGLSENNKTKLFEELARTIGAQLQTPEQPLEKIQAFLKTKKYTKPIVITFAGFDKLEKNFTKDLFDDLRAIRSVNRNNILFVFGVCKRLETLISDEVMNSEISMFSTKYYLKPYSTQDCTYLLKKYGPFTKISEDKIQLSGGHFQLLQLLLQTEFPAQPLNDQFIQLCLRNIFSHLSPLQKKTVQKIAEGKFNTEDKTYIQNIGILTSDNKFFSPLFKEFILNSKIKKIPAKEGKLFKLLKSRMNQIISKEEIFKIVWKENTDNASDWALDSLIYRLRKNEIFQKSGFVIESIKKQGYRLTKN